MSDNLPWKTWTPDDLAPPQAEFVPMVEPEETIIEEAEPSLEQQLAQLQMQAHEQGYQAGIAEGRQQGHKQGYQEGLARGLEQGLAEAKSQQAPIHARMQQLVSEFQTTLDALDSVIASRLMQMAVKNGKATRPQLHCGICGEHGGDPSSVEFCHQIGLDYVSCSPFRVPIARLAAAQAAIAEKNA